jgi:hypothetical protein
MSKDAADNPNRISVILLNNQGDQPLDPEVFRQSALAGARERDEHQ